MLAPPVVVDMVVVIVRIARSCVPPFTDQVGVCTMRFIVNVADEVAELAHPDLQH